MKKMAARNFEYLLQVRLFDIGMPISSSNPKSYMRQWAIPVFDGLLPSQHNEVVMTSLYQLVEWHALAKLRMHTDMTLSLMDLATTAPGQQLCRFCQDVCFAYSTKDLLKEQAARKRKKQCDQARNKNA